MTTVKRETNITLSNEAIDYNSHVFDKTTDGTEYVDGDAASKGATYFSDHKSEFDCLANGGMTHRKLEVASDGSLASEWFVLNKAVADKPRDGKIVGFQKHDGSYLDPSKMTDAFSPTELNDFITNLLPIYDKEIDQLMTVLTSHVKATPDEPALKAALSSDPKSLRGAINALYDLSAFTQDEHDLLDLTDLHFDYLRNGLILGDVGGQYTLPADILAKTKGRMPVADWTANLVAKPDTTAADTIKEITGAQKFTTAQSLVLTILAGSPTDPNVNENVENIDTFISAARTAKPDAPEDVVTTQYANFSHSDVLADQNLTLENINLNGIDDGFEYRPANARNDDTTISSIGIDAKGKHFVDQDGKALKVGPIVLPAGVPANDPLQAFAGQTYKPGIGSDGTLNTDAMAFAHYLHDLSVWASSGNKVKGDTEPMTLPKADTDALAAAGLQVVIIPAADKTTYPSISMNLAPYGINDAAGQPVTDIQLKTTDGVSYDLFGKDGTTPIKLDTADTGAHHFPTMNDFTDVIYLAGLGGLVIRDGKYMLNLEAKVVFLKGYTRYKESDLDAANGGRTDLDAKIAKIKTLRQELRDKMHVVVQGTASSDGTDSKNLTLANHRGETIYEITKRDLGLREDQVEFLPWAASEVSKGKAAPFYANVPGGRISISIDNTVTSVTPTTPGAGGATATGDVLDVSAPAGHYGSITTGLDNFVSSSGATSVTGVTVSNDPLGTDWSAGKASGTISGNSLTINNPFRSTSGATSVVGKTFCYNVTFNTGKTVTVRVTFEAAAAPVHAPASDNTGGNTPPPAAPNGFGG
jgi:hypothetical protein